MSENLQYWINQNGTQSGPHTIEQLESMALDKAHTYVWHKGMDGWKRIDKIPELAHLTAEPEPAAPQESAVEPIEADAITEEPHEAPTEEEAAAPVPPEYVEPEVQVPPFVPQMPPQMQQMQAPAPECPPTNLVAAIVCAVLCCTPLAVVAIVLAVMTKNKYSAGEYAKPTNTANGERGSAYCRWCSPFCLCHSPCLCCRPCECPSTRKSHTLSSQWRWQ